MQLRISLVLMLLLSVTASYGSGQAAATARNQRQTALDLEQKGNFADAESVWRLYLKAHSGNPEPYAHLGILEARKEHYKEAAQFYRKALALNPSVPGLRLDLGLALFKGGELKQAIQEFTPLLKKAQPATAEAQRLTILIGMAHYGLGEYTDAVPFLRGASGGDSQNLQLLLALAHSCMWSKQYQCVMDTYHQILTLNAESAEADMLAGEALDELHDHDGAIQQFRAAVQANPKEPDAHFGLGYLLWTQRKYTEAASEFQAELGNDPNHAQAMTYLADTNLQLVHPETAAPLLKKAIGIDPKLELAHLDLGIVYADQGQQTDALRELQQAERMDPKDVNTHWRLGQLYRSMGKKDEAKIEFDKARQINLDTDTAVINKMNNTHSKPAKDFHPDAKGIQ